MTRIACLVTILFLLNHVEVFLAEDVMKCPPNHFKLENMVNCHPWIGCKDMDNITINKRLGTGAIKDVFLVDWKGILVVLSVPVNPKFLEDFLNGVNILRLLNPSKHIVQYLGYCDLRYALFTEYHPRGNAASVFSTSLKKISVIESLEFCQQYSFILNHLHKGPAGRRVFCDSNNLDKLLSQLLITSNTRLILNDVDALPEVVNSSGVICGHRQLEGSFVAPEQLWTRDDNYTEELMPGYDEKTDIWKAAAVCDFFIKRAVGGEVVRYRLFDLHDKCRSRDPSSRPTSEELSAEYTAVINEFRHFEL